MPRVDHDLVAIYVFREFEDRKELLLLRRAEGLYMGGTWQPVYGKLRAEETCIRGALRELHEETDLKPINFYQLDSVDVFFVAKVDTIYHCVNFAAEIDPLTEVRLNHEHDRFEWVDIAEANDRLFWPGQRYSLVELREMILDNGAAKPFLCIDPGDQV